MGKRNTKRETTGIFTYDILNRGNSGIYEFGASIFIEIRIGEQDSMFILEEKKIADELEKK